MGIRREISLLLLLLTLASFATAADFDRVITNSEDWTDVYSGIHYATLSGVQANFLTSTAHGSIIINEIGKNETVRVVTSQEDQYVINYPSMLMSQGLNYADEISSRNLNVELIDNLEEIDNFIVVGDNYGYNAMAVVPYAVQKKAWVFFANEANIGEIDDFLANRDINELIIYGYTDRTVRDTLDKYSPEVIDTGDRFEDNIEIVQKYLEIKDSKQASLTNGEFIEMELMNGQNPILFTGKENVPDKISEYIKDSPIEIGILVGNDLMGAATNIRHSTGISVMVKFARGARSANAGIAAVEGLDLFPLPTPQLSLELYALEYNILSKQLEATYKSTSNVPAYFKGTITMNADGDRTILGDNETLFVAPNSYKTVTYPIELTTYEDLTAQVYTIFGEAKSALDRAISLDVEVGTIEVIDKCQLEIKEVSYNKQSNEFKIKVKNTAQVDCWAEGIINNLEVGYEEKTIASEQTIKIEAESSNEIMISEELLKEDLNKNKFVEAVVYYGQKESSLVNTEKGRFELNVQSITTTTTLIAVLVAAIALLLVFFVKKRKAEKLDDFL